MDYESLLLNHLGVVDDIVRFVARRQRLTADEVEDLSSAARLKLVENDYQVLRGFQGRSSLKTYLSAVIHRLALDARIARWGKWRPSAQARRLGPAAVLLDRMLNRDGVELDQAIGVMRSQGAAESVSELQILAAQLPARVRRQFVSEEQIESLPAPPPDDSSMLTPADVATGADALEEALNAALAALSGVDRLILKMRFLDELPVARIARLVDMEQKPLYRRIDNVMKVLRRELEVRGIQQDQVLRLIGHPAMNLGPVIEDSAARNRVPQ